jgi:hypothetical protein
MTPGAAPATPAAPAGPAGVTPGAGGGGGAIFIPQHGKTTRELLFIDWDYPVYQVKKTAGAEGNDGQTVAVSVDKALPREKALWYLAEEDQRPLLILRECEFCNGTDDALLSTSTGNEKTFLLSKWFHCVKLPTHVLKEDHPFTNLFENKKKTPHLFVCSADGSSVIPLKGDQAQGELWSAMSDILANDYKKDADTSVKNLMKILAEYDHIDSMEDLYQEKIQAEIEKRGPKSSKLRKMRAKVKTYSNRRDQLKKEEAKLFELGLIPTAPKVASK